MANAPKTKTKTAGAAERGLQGTARRASFWRGGHQFGAEPRRISLADLTPEQADAIRQEGQPGGQLVVSEVDMPAEKAAEAS